MCEGYGWSCGSGAGRQAEVDRTGGDGLSCQEQDAQVQGKRRMAVE